MAEILITGHRNPDMDSVCAAAVYADFKNRLKDGNVYTPIRCGHMNKATKMVFNKFKLTAPEYRSDIHPRVIDVARRNITALDINEPVFNAIKELDDKTISVIPVFENENEFKGIVSIHEISNFLISATGGERPIYHFRINNFQKVLPGYFYQRGEWNDFQAPIMTGAMPYELSVTRIKELDPLKPLLVIGLREDLIQFAADQQFPALVLTGVKQDQPLPVDLTNYKGTIFISHADTAETIRLLRLSTPLKSILEDSPERIKNTDTFDFARERLTRSSLRGLPVFNGNQFCGIVTRRCFIDKPQRKLILVDHNEVAQSVKGADEAEIVEIIDHHRLGALKTRKPIYIYAQPLGSSCTLVYQHYKIHGVEISKEMAGLMMAGILSDTVILKSPTTTPHEIQALKELSEISGIDYEELGKEIFSCSSSLKGSEPKEAIPSDFKVYEESKLKIGVGQMEVTTLEDYSSVVEDYKEELENQKRERGLDWTMLLVTNVLKEDSLLFSSEYRGGEELLHYKKIAEGVYELPHIISRKKQLLPEILRIAEEMNGLSAGAASLEND